MTYMSVTEGYLLYFLPVNYFDYVPVMVKTFVQISLCVCVFIYSITILIYYLHYKTQNKKKSKNGCDTVCSVPSPSRSL